MAQSKTSKRSSLVKPVEENYKDYALPRFTPATGADWCCKRDRRKANRGKGQTTGKVKGNFCIASPLRRFMARCSRSYKHPRYEAWLNNTLK